MNRIVLLLAIFSFSCANGLNDVVVDSLRLFVDNKEFFIKGMCYNPAPLGQRSLRTDEKDGGGYCSPKMTPYGEWKSACYDSDYFDGAPDVADREPAGPPSGGWFQALWERDFPYLKMMGVNTIRIYNTNPTTRQASIAYPNLVPLPNGKSHTQFLDYAASFGFKVIFPLLGDYGMLVGLPASDFNRLLQWQIDEVGNHPAILMWTLGNELPISAGTQNIVNMLNERMAFARNYTLSKWNRRLPITVAVVDDPSTYNYLMENLNVDVFTTNAGYRGETFTDLWSGNGITSGMYRLSCRTQKPIFVGEIGWHTENNAILASKPYWFNENWKDLVTHIDQGCIGGAFFEFSDEPLKADVLQKTMGTVSYAVSTQGGVPSTSPDAWHVDKVVPKQYLYSIANGTFQGIPYNMNSDPFSLIGRQPYSLGCSPSICAAVNINLQSNYQCSPTSSSGSSSSSSTSSSSTTSSSTSSPTVSPSTVATSSSTSSTSKAGTTATSTTAKAASSSTVNAASTSTAKSTTTATTKSTTSSSTFKGTSSSTSKATSTSTSASVSTSSTTGSTSAKSTTTSSPLCGATSCGSYECCNDIVMGPICVVQPTAYDCVQGIRLCGKGLGVCNTICFDQNLYVCVNGVITQRT